VFAAGADLEAATDRVPCRFGPFDFGLQAHFRLGSWACSHSAMKMFDRLPSLRRCGIS
jgi:hypothetical protein